MAASARGAPRAHQQSRQRQGTFGNPTAPPALPALVDPRAVAAATAVTTAVTAAVVTAALLEVTLLAEGRRMGRRAAVGMPGPFPQKLMKRKEAQGVTVAAAAAAVVPGPATKKGQKLVDSVP